MSILLPSINDQIATGTGGSFLGRYFLRMANLALEGDGDKPDILHEFGAAIISPPTGINRFVFGERFGPCLQPSSGHLLLHAVRHRSEYGF